MDLGLTDKVAIVTGSSRGLGLAAAKSLAAEGCRICVCARTEARLRQAADEVARAGAGSDHVLAVAADVSRAEGVQSVINRAVATFGGIDILVNNAALMVEAVGTPAIRTEIADFERLLRINVLGALICVKAAVPLMQSRGGGKIVNQLSAGAWPAQTPYGVSKIALHGLTTTLATELGPLNINVNAIAPGMTMSDAGKALTPDDSPFVKAAMARVVMRPRGEPDDLVGALLLLCSSAGDWITGQVLNVDGGFVLRN